VDVPEDVGLDDVQAAVLGLLDQLRPHLHPSKPPHHRRRDAGVVSTRAGKDTGETKREKC
jgi:hypothetical protein